MSELLDHARSARRSLNVVETSSAEVKEAAKAIDDLSAKLDELLASHAGNAAAAVAVNLLEYTAVKAYLETLKAQGKTFEEQRKALARLAQQEMLMGDPKKVKLRDPNVQEELHYHCTAGGKYDPKEKK